MPNSVGPSDSRISRLAEAQSGVSVPPTETTTSPGSSPASWAGVGGRSSVHSVMEALCGTTHSLTTPTSLVSWYTPTPMKSTPSSTVPRTRFMPGPANMTISRFHGERW